MMILLLSACTWVSSADLAARLEQVDDDGDGWAASLDCDDGSAAVHPEAAETWYDGVDADCAGDDDFDQDHDGAAQGVDCDDLQPAVNPGATEVPYDGVDNDCAGGDEVDVDADGSPYGEDCDDADPDTYPGAPEVWYDGVDQDCLGDGDDDQDGDGSPVAEDCDDLDPARYPGAVDSWYDGVDSDCAGDDDYDQDLDGHLDATGGGDDCDDTAADVNPDVLEQIGDPVDGDCDGTPDGFRLRALPGRTWVAPAAPVLVVRGSEIELSVVATSLTDGTDTLYDSAPLFSFVPSDANLSFAAGEAWVSNSSDPSSYTVGAAAGWYPEGYGGYGVLPLDTTSGRALLLAWFDAASSTRQTVSVAGASGTAPFEDVSLHVGGGGSHEGLGCESTEGVLAWARVDERLGTSADASVELAGMLAAACSFDDAGQVWAAVGGWLTRVDLAEDVDGWYGTAVPVFDGVHAVDLDPFPGGLAGVDGDSGTVFTFDGAAVTEWPLADAFARVALLDDGSGGVAVGTDGVARWVAPDGTATALTAPSVVEDASAVESGGYRLVAVTGPDGVAVGYAKLP